MYKQIMPVENLMEFSVAFQNGSFGLRYDQDDKNITDFFQKIENNKRE